VIDVGDSQGGLVGNTMDRRTLLRAGIASGISVATLGVTAQPGAAATGVGIQTITIQGPWRHCKNCQGLAWGDAQAVSKCPNKTANGGHHTQSGSLWYFLRYSPDGQGPDQPAIQQPDWKHCKKCQSLAYNGQGVLGYCPAGNQHDHTGSHNYYLWHDSDDTPIYRQSLWRYCDKCASLFYEPGLALSRCPAPGGGQHRKAATSYNYYIQYDTYGPVGT